MATDPKGAVSLAKGPIASRSALLAAGFEGNFVARGLRPANGFNGRALPDTTVIGAFTATNFFVSCSQHRPLEAYFIVLEKAGFLVEALREPGVPEHAIVSGGGRR